MGRPSKLSPEQWAEILRAHFGYHLGMDARSQGVAGGSNPHGASAKRPRGSIPRASAMTGGGYGRSVGAVAHVGGDGDNVGAERPVKGL